MDTFIRIAALTSIGFGVFTQVVLMWQLDSRSFVLPRWSRRGGARLLAAGLVVEAIIAALTAKATVTPSMQDSAQSAPAWIEHLSEAIAAVGILEILSIVGIVTIRVAQARSLTPIRNTGWAVVTGIVVGMVMTIPYVIAQNSPPMQMVSLVFFTSLAASLFVAAPVVYRRQLTMTKFESAITRTH